MLLYGLRSYGLLISDDGYAIYPSLRMLEGELLYRDVHHYYAPLTYHALELALAIGGPSLLSARTLWMLFLLGGIAGTYRIARRLAPPVAALLPAATYALVPGPWHKAFYGLCTVLFLLALTRALERKSPARHLLLGAVCGVTLMSRQELGAAQLVVAAAIVGAVPLWPLQRPLRRESFRLPILVVGLRRALLVCGGFAAALAPLVAYYVAKGNLGNLIDAVFVQAYRYSDRPLWKGLQQVVPVGDFARAQEGPAVAILLLIALLFAALAAAFVVRAILRQGLDARTGLAAALVAMLIPAVLQSYNPPLLVRFLQSAICFYLLLLFVLGELGPRARKPATLFAGLSLALYVGFVIGGPQKVQPSDANTGSLRSLRHTAQVRVLGDVVRTDEATAGEIRLVQAFIAERTRPGEPIFTAPLHSTYYLLVERPNPTAFLGDIPFANLAMSRERKVVEMQRLLASKARYAIVDREWWSKRGGPSHPVLDTLTSSFAPVRLYGSVAILERDSSPERLGLHAIAGRIWQGRARRGDAASLRKILRTRPDDPVGNELLAELLLERGKTAAAVAPLEAALGVDPENPRLRTLREYARIAVP